MFLDRTTVSLEIEPRPVKAMQDLIFKISKDPLNLITSYNPNFNSEQAFS